MAELADPALVVRLPKRGIEFTRFVEYEIDSDYFTSTDGFSFTLMDPDRTKTFGHELQQVDMVIDGAPQLLGRVDESSVGDTSAITYSGRDYLADAVECQVDPTLEIKEGMTLYDAITLACSPIGIFAVLDDDGERSMRDVRSGKQVRTGAKAPPGFRTAKASDLKPREDDGIYQFCSRLAARFGATLQPYLERTQILMSAPYYVQHPSFAIRVTDNTNSAESNNAYNCKAKRNYSKVPTYALFQGRGSVPGKLQSPLSSEYNIPIEASIQAFSLGFFKDTGEELIKHAGTKRRPPKPGIIYPDTLYRMRFHRDTTARSQEQLDAILRRDVSERIKDSLLYTCTMRGHRDPETGVLYSVDTVADVSDDIRNVHERMWVKGRKFRYTQSGGAETDLTMIRLGVVQL